VISALFEDLLKQKIGWQRVSRSSDRQSYVHSQLRPESVYLLLIPQSPALPPTSKGRAPVAEHGQTTRKIFRCLVVPTALGRPGRRRRVLRDTNRYQKALTYPRHQLSHTLHFSSYLSQFATPGFLAIPHGFDSFFDLANDGIDAFTEVSVSASVSAMSFQAGEMLAPDLSPHPSRALFISLALSLHAPPASQGFPFPQTALQTATHRSSSTDRCSVPVCSFRSLRRLAASSYCAVISAEVDWKAVDEGGCKCGKRYFCRSASC
jgi:hypothetical protein